MIPFRVKKLTPTAKLPERANEGDLWDLFVDSFSIPTDDGMENISFHLAKISVGHRLLIRTGIAIELPKYIYATEKDGGGIKGWFYDFDKEMAQRKDYIEWKPTVKEYAVADIRPRSGLALKRGITVLNTPGTIDNSYRKEIGVILYNAGHEPYTIRRGDKIAQMLIRPLYPSSFEVVEEFEDTGRGGFGSTGK